MLGYFNIALFDVALFTVELLNVVLFKYCTINATLYQSVTI